MVLDYSIAVHDYITYAHDGPAPLVLQSPQVPNGHDKTIVVQERLGPTENKVSVLDTKDVRLDPNSSGPHTAAAHGVVLASRSGGGGRRAERGDPLWIWENGQEEGFVIGSNSIPVVNLWTGGTQEVLLREVAWVPDMEGPDTLITFTGAIPIPGGGRGGKKRHRKKARLVVVIVQEITWPFGARLAIMNPETLQSYKNVRQDPVRRRQLFDTLLENPRPQMSLYPAGSPYASSMSCSSSVDGLDSDDEGGMGSPPTSDEYDSEHATRQQQLRPAKRKTRSYRLDPDPRVKSKQPCTQCPPSSVCPNMGFLLQLLLPTAEDPYPAHHHLTDTDCIHGRAHSLHCIYPQRELRICVIHNPTESHSCCVHVPSGELSRAWDMFFNEDEGKPPEWWKAKEDIQTTMSKPNVKERLFLGENDVTDAVAAFILARVRAGAVEIDLGAIEIDLGAENSLTLLSSTVTSAPALAWPLSCPTSFPEAFSNTFPVSAAPDLSVAAPGGPDFGTVQARLSPCEVLHAAQVEFDEAMATCEIRQQIFRDLERQVGWTAGQDLYLTRANASFFPQAILPASPGPTSPPALAAPYPARTEEGSPDVAFWRPDNETPEDTASPNSPASTSQQDNMASPSSLLCYAGNGWMLEPDVVDDSLARLREIFALTNPSRSSPE